MSHPIPGQEYPCETCGEHPDDCACHDNEPTKNEFEVAADDYIASAPTLPQIETALRQAFYAGVQHGINVTREIYRPELSDEEAK
jgi:hypothetical protein